jgi:hypothetical protein
VASDMARPPRVVRQSPTETDHAALSRILLRFTGNAGRSAIYERSEISSGYIFKLDSKVVTLP